MNHEWLWDVVFWGAYRMHPDAAAWLNYAIVCAIFFLVFATTRRTCGPGSKWSAGFACLIAAFVCEGFLDVRPHLITLLFTGVLILTHRKRWAPWLWPPLIALWANLHAGYVFGVGVIGLIVLVRTLKIDPGAGRWRWKLRWSGPRRLWLGLAFSLLAMLANPWGAELLAYPLEYLQPRSPFRTISEWQAPPWGWDPRSFEGRFWWVALLAAAGFRAGWRRERELVALSLVTFAMAVVSRRFIPLFAVTAAPLIGLLFRDLGARWPARPAGSLRLMPAVAALAIATLLVSGVRLVPRFLDRWTRADTYPEAAIQVLNELGPPRRVFNDYVWGGYILLRAPEARVFIDQRANTVYDESILHDYRFLISGKPGLRDRLSGYGADAALVRTGSPVAEGLARGPGAWTAVYSDSLATILLPPDSPFRGKAKSPQAHPDVLIRYAGLEEERGNYGGAAGLLRQARDQDPLLMRVYARLARVRARVGDARGVARSIEHGLRVQPRRKDFLRQAEARAYESMGETELALQALAKVSLRGPFDDRGHIDRWIRRLRKSR
ncbi:MAG: hypothetical protein V3T01_04815 [Myxococcota bacterium]